jgi:ATP-dependent helicase/nuclease subunit A
MSTATPDSRFPTPSDQPARDRILTDLDTNLLVEAGAGSGKTTSLVGRMLSLIARGMPVERIAAVTFTRRAANELRERLQQSLEKRIRTSPVGSEERERFERALRDVGSAFVGTIHSFCGLLLRERPLEVLLDPEFQEVSEEDWDELVRSFWHRWLERARREGDADLLALSTIGIDARELLAGFTRVVTYPDVEFALDPTPAPDTRDCRRALDALLRAATDATPAQEPEGGWDKLQLLARRLAFKSRVEDWSDPVAFCNAIGGIAASACAVTQYKWGATREAKADAKALGEAWKAWLEGDATELLRRWREHRYPMVMRVLLRAARDFAAERHATGQLGFADLLLLAAKLLRESPAARAELGARFERLLVDEFQDTDPVQAEVCLLLASDPTEGDDWRLVRPRAGALFVVGDPKQSIYRFRRADIQVYELVKRRFASFGDLLALTENFRSVEAIGALVNGYFRERFPEQGTAQQAPFREMRTRKTAQGGDGVYHYRLRPETSRGRVSKETLLRTDAEHVASWIAARIARDEHRAGSFMILTPTKEAIAYYARALSARRVPVSTAGAKLPQERELTELLVVLRALADPENAVLVAAALEGLFFGLSPAALLEGREAGLRFSITHPPASDDLAAGRALAKLHEWWRLTQRHPVDAVLDRILDDTGLLALSASEPLGDARAGALLHLIEVLRGASTRGASAITDAVERLELLLGKEAPDAPLRPGRTDAVRVLNLHKAKGLEADVVVLAAPLDRGEFPPKEHVRRSDADGARGALLVLDAEGSVVAQPPEWEAMAQAEEEFLAAERQRLLYVAATRARRELVVSGSDTEQKAGLKPDDSIWSDLVPALDGAPSPSPFEAAPAEGRPVVTRAAVDVLAAVAEADARRAAAHDASLHVQTVTERAKAQHDEARARDLALPAGLGAAWGRAVHRALEGLGRGREGARLAAYLRAVAADEGLSAEQSEALPRLVADVRESDAWQRIVAADARLQELTVMHRADGPDAPTIVEGVIDAASRDALGWTILDWKSDAVDDAEWGRRLPQYERQAGEYAAMVERLTGERVVWSVERVKGSI